MPSPFSSCTNVHFHSNLSLQWDRTTYTLSLNLNSNIFFCTAENKLLTYQRGDKNVNFFCCFYFYCAFLFAQLIEMFNFFFCIFKIFTSNSKFLQKSALLTQLLSLLTDILFFSAIWSICCQIFLFNDCFL